MICDDSYANGSIDYPQILPYELFEVIEEDWSKYSHMQTPIKDKANLKLGFKEYVEEPYFYGNLLEGYKRELDVFDLDYERRKTKFIKHNDCCGSFDETIGATPAYLKNGISIISNDFIYRSEYRFASYADKGYLTIIGLDTMGKMKQAKMKSLYYDNVFQKKEETDIYFR